MRRRRLSLFFALELDTFCQAECIFHLNREIQYRAINFAMTQQKLYGSEVSGFGIDQSGFRTTH